MPLKSLSGWASLIEILALIFWYGLLPAAVMVGVILFGVWLVSPDVIE